MLDKSIPYKNIIMRRPAERVDSAERMVPAKRLEPAERVGPAERIDSAERLALEATDRKASLSDGDLPDPSLPSGFSFKCYGPGDAKHWAEIETSVLEFSDVHAAEKYFGQDFLPSEEALQERMVFVVSDSGEYVATATAWWNEFKGRHQAALHWVSVRPEFQGLGLGGAVVMKALSLFTKYEPGMDVYLHTQTWSHKAVRLYAKLGFRICKTDTLGNQHNDYSEAMGILKKVLDESAYSELERAAVD
jgi:ribosomal protein S18 acetylase RimI-like enzyme